MLDKHVVALKGNNKEGDGLPDQTFKAAVQKMNATLTFSSHVTMHLTVLVSGDISRQLRSRLP